MHRSVWGPDCACLLLLCDCCCSPAEPDTARSPLRPLQAAHRIAADPRQSFVSLRLASALQVLLGIGVPLLHHYHLDKQRRERWRREEDQRRRRQQTRRRRRPQALWQQPHEG